MRWGTSRPAVASMPRAATATETAVWAGSAPRRAAGWERRLYAGLRIEGVPLEAHAALVQSLGEIGVEAEYFLGLVRALPTSHPSHEAGALFLAKLQAAGQRLRRVAASLEVATQGFLSALAAAHGDIPGDGDVWWPAPAELVTGGEPLELSLRRCGYAYRHVVAAHLASHVEAIGEHLTLILHALSTLPPAGTLPASTLRAGLDELTSGLQGYVVPNHLIGLSQRTPGLLWGIAQLRALDAHEETSLESDIAWAHAQYSLARQPHPSTQVGTIAAVNVRSSHAPARWAASAAQEWRDTITALERLRRR
jgi:hypothetical protein